ncbi:hypothetical protein IFM89_009014, partial [Coptis chinensis]
ARKDNSTHNKEQQDVREEFTKENPKKESSLPIVEPSAKERQGRTGSTYLCIENSTGIEYACKSIQKRKLISKEDVEDVRGEVQIMHHLSGHKYIVSIKGAYEDSLFVHIVMELCAGGTLYDHISQRGRCSEWKTAELMRIIVGVVETCHSLGVMHRDLKPENFMLVNKDGDFSLKAIDFGLSIFFKPEADMWSAGVVMYVLLSGIPPFWAETQPGTFDMVLRGVIDFESDPWPLISDSAQDLLRKMLCSQPWERFTVHEVLCHPWICRAKEPAVLSCLKRFSAMNKLKRMAVVWVIAERLSEEELAGLKEMFEVMDTDNSGTITFNELKAGLRRYGCTLKESEIRDLMEANCSSSWLYMAACLNNTLPLKLLKHSIVHQRKRSEEIGEGKRGGGGRGRTSIYGIIQRSYFTFKAFLDGDKAQTENAVTVALMSTIVGPLTMRSSLQQQFIVASLNVRNIWSQCLHTLTKAEVVILHLMKLRQACLEHNMSNVDLGDIISEVDQDNADVDYSGTIDYEEFIAATVHCSKLEREEHLVAVFAYFDKSGSGYITFDELRQACLEHNMSNVDLGDIISEVDQDNDGRIDYGEFVAMMTKGNEVLED